jgi:hypothetical protein
MNIPAHSWICCAFIFINVLFYCKARYNDVKALLTHLLLLQVMAPLKVLLTGFLSIRRIQILMKCLWYDDLFLSVWSISSLIISFNLWYYDGAKCGPLFAKWFSWFRINCFAILFPTLCGTSVIVLVIFSP